MKYQWKTIVLRSHVSQLRRLSACVGRTGMLREIHVVSVDVTQLIAHQTVNQHPLLSYKSLGFNTKLQFYRLARLCFDSHHLFSYSQ
jgi:hypothetical protein